MEAVLTNPSGRMTLGSSVVRIGSAQDNHVVINDPKVSTHHAEIRPEGRAEHSHTITDIGSTTGTFVNERRLDYNVPSLLHPNDAIRIGDAVFNYEVTDLPQAAPPRVGTTGYGSPGDPGFPGTVAAPSSSFGSGTAAASPPAYPSTSYSPPAYSPGAFAPPPSGSIAPVSPFGSISPSPTYTVASLLEKENRRKVWLAVGITALIILIVAFIFGSAHSPGKTLDTFCSALQSGDYQTAYNQFSPGLQGIVTEPQFVSSFGGNRRIALCTHSSPSVSGNSAMATIITNAGSGQSTLQVWLIQDSSFNWKIDNLR